MNHQPQNDSEKAARGDLENASERSLQQSKPMFGSSQSPAEWISFLLASAILVGVLATVGYLWVRDRDQQPPILAVVLEGNSEGGQSVEKRQNQYYVSFTVTNEGGETAAAVQVIAELRIDGTLAEWGDQQIDFLSSQETASGAFVFTRNPGVGELIVRVASYKQP